MYSDHFEQAFDCFLNCFQYEQAQNAMFTLVRSAFVAGWNVAGGDTYFIIRLA